MDKIAIDVTGKKILLKTFGNVALNEQFSARIVPGRGEIRVESDLNGLKR